MKKKIIFGKEIAVFMLLLLSFSYASNSLAGEVSEPQQIVQDATEKMLKALKDNEAELKEDPDLIFSLVESIIMPNFDFNKIAKLALGKNWRKASEEQRQQFTEEFRKLLIRTYATAMLEYTDQKINFLPVRGDVKKKKVKIPMEILQSGGPSIPMALSMYQNKQDVWKVYDVKIDGVSLVTNYRSTFSTQIRNGGIDNLIEHLVEKNKKVNV